MSAHEAPTGTPLKRTCLFCFLWRTAAGFEGHGLRQPNPPPRPPPMPRLGPPVTGAPAPGPQKTVLDRPAPPSHRQTSPDAFRNKWDGQCCAVRGPAHGPVVPGCGPAQRSAVLRGKGARLHRAVRAPTKPSPPGAGALDVPAHAPGPGWSVGGRAGRIRGPLPPGPRRPAPLRCAAMYPNPTGPTPSWDPPPPAVPTVFRGQSDAPRR